MSNLTGLMPVRHGVAAYAALCQEADRARSAGDDRSRGQIMADILFERVTGQSAATGPAVSVGLVMTDRSLFAGDQDPAVVPGYGPVPAPWARDLLRGNGGSETMRRPSQPSEPAEAEVFVRRLFTHPHTGELVAMESRSKTFPPGLRDQLITRDQVCRTPWCDALVRHADHATAAVEGGATSEVNGQGLCEACNYAKTAPGWAARAAPDSSLGAHLIETRTPTGHRYRSRPPPLPGAPPVPPGWRSRARADGGPKSSADLVFLDGLTSWDPTRHAA
jgi:hypothetical protein